MQVYEAKAYGVFPNSQVAKPLAALFAKLQADEAEKTLVFSAGTYYIDSAECDEHMLYITNTVGDAEFSADETPHKNVKAPNRILFPFPVSPVQESRKSAPNPISAI